jgi:hypothetical protein
MELELYSTFLDRLKSISEREILNLGEWDLLQK